MDDTLDLGTLHAKMAVDNTPYDRGIDAAHKKMDGLGQSTGKTLEEMHGKFSREGAGMGTDLGDAVAKGTEEGVKRAAEGVDGIWRDAQGKLRTAKGKFIREGTILGEEVAEGIGKGSQKGLGLFGRNLDVVRTKMNDLHKKVGGFRGQLSLLGKVAAFAAIITGAAGAASAIGPVVGLVGSLVVAVGGLAAAVPAFAAGAVAVIGTVKLAFQGLGDAIAGDEEALERLTGPARRFVGVIEGLKPAWEDIQRSVQSRFFEHMSGIFERVAGNVLPRLKAGLVQVSGGLAEFAAAALDAADSPRFLAGMSAVLKATGSGFAIAAEGVGGWVRGIGLLLSKTAPLIERVGLAFADAGEQFGDWMERASASGELQSTLDTMVQTLGYLFGIVGNVGSIFGSVFGAAAEQGGGLLGIIEDLTGRVDTFLKSSEGQEGLADFFSRLRDVGDAVAPVLLAVVGAVGDLAPKIADIAEGVGPSLADLFERVGDAVGKIDAEALAEGLADVLDAVTPLIGPIGDLFGGLSSLDGLIPIIAISLGVFTIAVWALNAALWANPIVWIIGLIIALIAVIVLMIVNWDTWTASLVLSWELTKEKAAEIWGAIADFFVGIWDSITGYIGDRVDDVKAIMAWFGTLPYQFAVWFGGVKDSAVDKLVSLLAWVKNLPGEIGDALGDLGSLLYNAGRDILQGLIDGIQSMWSSVESKFTDLTAMIPNWKGPASVDRDLLKGPAGLIMGGFAEHLESLFPLVRGVLSDLTSEIGLSVDGSAAPTTMAAPTINVIAPGPGSFTATAEIDLGNGIKESFEVEFTRRDRELTSRVRAGSGAL